MFTIIRYIIDLVSIILIVYTIENSENNLK